MSEETSADMAPVPGPPASAASGGGPGALWPAEPESTGDDDVDAQLALLRHLPGLPVAEHGGLYARLHDGLRSALDDMPGEP